MRRILIVLLLGSLSCSLVQRKPSPELANALVSVSATYLRYVVNMDEAKIGNSILWSDFLSNNEIKKEDYLKKLPALRKRFRSPATHPLLGLSIHDIKWNDNRASVSFIKSGAKGSTPIELELFWGSNSWLVVDDNLFGTDELIDRWTKG